MEVFSGSREPQFMAVFLAFRRLDGFFFFVFFSRSSGRPGVSASFSSPRALTPVSARGLLPISFQLLSGSFMCGQTHMLMSFPKQQQQQHSIALVLNQRRRLNSVFDVIQGIQASMYSVAPGPDSSGQWNKVLTQAGRVQQAWLPFSRATKRHVDVDEFLRDFGERLPTLDGISLPLLTVDMLFDAVHAKPPSAGGFDGWVWNDFRPWCGCLKSLEGIKPQLYADNVKCVRCNSDVLLDAARVSN